MYYDYSSKFSMSFVESKNNSYTVFYLLTYYELYKFLYYNDTKILPIYIHNKLHFPDIIQKALVELELPENKSYFKQQVVKALCL